MILYECVQRTIDMPIIGMSKIGKSRDGRSQTTLVFKLGNNHVIFQFLLVPVEFVRNQNTCIFLMSIVLIFTTITFNNKFSGIETPLDVVYYKSEEKNAILKKQETCLKGLCAMTNYTNGIVFEIVLKFGSNF